MYNNLICLIIKRALAKFGKTKQSNIANELKLVHFDVLRGCKQFILFY